MTTKQNSEWEEEFDEKWGGYKSEELKSFISQTLAKQREEIVDEIEKDLRQGKSAWANVLRQFIKEEKVEVKRNKKFIPCRNGMDSLGGCIDHTCPKCHPNKENE